MCEEVYFVFLMPGHILLLTTRSRLSIAQANGSFKLFDTRTFRYATPTFITEALRLVTQVQLL